MRRPSGANKFYDEDQARTLKRIPIFYFRASSFELRLSIFHFLFSILAGSEPAATEQDAWAARRKKDRPTIVARLVGSILQSGMQSRAASGGAKVAGCPGDRRKGAWRNAALLREQSHEAGIWLVRGKRADGTARNAAAPLHACHNLFQAGDFRTAQNHALAPRAAASPR